MISARSRDLGREIAQFDTPEVGQANFGAAVRFAASPVDICFDLPHLLISNHQKVARPASRIEYPDLRYSPAQIEQHARIVARFLKPCAKLIEKQRIEYLQDVRHTGVVHPECTALFIFSDGLDHRAEDVRIDLCPIEIADMDEIGSGDPAKARDVHAAREQAAVHIRERVRPARDFCGLSFGYLCIHGAKQCADHLVRVRRIPHAHLLNGGGEQIVTNEDVGAFGKEAEDQPRHEVVHVVAPSRCPPIRIVLEKLDVELVQASGGSDVERVVADRLVVVMPASGRKKPK